MRPTPRLVDAVLMTTPSRRDPMLAGIPVSSRMLEIDGVATSVLEGGDGPPPVLLHGGIECGGVMWARRRAGVPAASESGRPRTRISRTIYERVHRDQGASPDAV
jgi:hypothetical protein